MDLCTGDWIYILGADDEFYDNAVLMELFEQGWFKEDQIVYGNVLIKGETVWAKDNSIYDGPFTLEKLFRKNICHQSIFYPRSVIQQVGYYSYKYAITADWDYNIHCWSRYSFHYTDKIIAVFQSGGVSARAADQEFLEERHCNIIEYFNINPNDDKFNYPDSPFYFPVSQYWKKEYLRRIRELETINRQLEQKLYAKDS